MGFLILLLVLAICIPLGIAAGKGLLRMQAMMNRTREPVVQPSREFTKYCPHCGKKVTGYADSEPAEWTCGECKCGFFSNGQISQETLAEYRRIDQWSGLNSFIAQVVDTTSKTGFITLKDGDAYLVSPDNPLLEGSSWRTEDVFVASYPTEGIGIVGELHLMQKCLNRCRTLDPAGAKEYWLMDRGLAWERKGN